MPIQAAANRLKREIETGKTKSEQPKAAPPAPAKVEEKKGGAKGGKGDKKAAAPAVVKVPPTQYEILMQIGIPESEIPEFKVADKWLKFFPPVGKEDL